MKRTLQSTAQRLRPLGGPAQIRVESDGQGRPVRIRTRSGQRVRVDHIRECWRIDDEWWRNPVSRLYFQVTLENGRSLTLYHDLVERIWYAH